MPRWETKIGGLPKDPQSRIEKKGFSGDLWTDLYACVDILQDYTGDDPEAKQLSYSRRPGGDSEAQELLEKMQGCIERLGLHTSEEKPAQLPERDWEQWNADVRAQSLRDLRESARSQGFDIPEPNPVVPDLSERQEQSPEEIEAMRRKYLEAFAVALGANELTARMTADALVRNVDEFSGLVYNGPNKREMDPTMAKQIDAVGSWILNGADKDTVDAIKFKIGALTLAILHEDVNSDFFKKFLRDWVGHIGEYGAEEKFTKMIAEEK